jgi:uncharacterized membrane protein YeaQ/YmgE (transglycosylase-associated protein family)
VVRLVGDEQRRHCGAAAAVRGRAGRNGLIRDGDPVAVARLGAGGVRPVRLEVDAVAGGVGGPLARDVGGRRHDGDARDAPLGQHAVRDVQAERRLAGGRRGGGEERVGRVGEDCGGRRLLPRAQRAVGRPGRQRQAGRVLSRRLEERRRRVTRGDDGPASNLANNIHAGKGVAVIGALILGLVAGFIGRALVPGDVFSDMSGPTSWLVSIVLGLVGAFVGYLIFTSLLGIGDDDAFDLGGILSAIIGVVIVLLIAGMVLRRGGGRRTPTATP